MGLFGKSKAPDPKLQCQVSNFYKFIGRLSQNLWCPLQEWCKRIRKEGYSMDRQINGIKREELKVTKSIKDAAKRGDKDVCRLAWCSMFVETFLS